MDTMDLFVRNWRERVKAAPWLTAPDKALFMRYAEVSRQEQISDSRISKYLTSLCTAHEITGLGLGGMIKSLAALEKAVGEINSSKRYSPLTKRDVKHTLASFFNFKHHGERSLAEAGRAVKRLARHIIKASDKRMARAVISREEVRELSKHTESIMDKALLWLLFESGMRNGEFQKMVVGDVVQIEEGLDVRVPAGKTGERPITAIEAAPFVLAWIDAHPTGKKDAPLWVDGRGMPLMRSAIARRLRMMRDALNEYRKAHGIPSFSKSVNPHNFRHSRATELGGEPGMTEQILCKIFGWQIGSEMPRTYLHLTPEQVRRAVLRAYGKAKPEEEKKVITSWVCPRCKLGNSLAMGYCGRCGASQDGKVISKTAILEARVRELEDRWAHVQKQAEIGAQFVKNYKPKPANVPPEKVAELIKEIESRMRR